MNRKLFNFFLAFALFGIALGFFGILYEGLVYGPKMLGDSRSRMLFWKDFYQVISPVFYYLPMNPLGMLSMIIVYLNADKYAAPVKRPLLYAILFQAASFLITIFIVKGIDMKTAFTNISLYASEIPNKTALFNGLSIVRILASGIAMLNVFRACLANARNLTVL